MPSALDVATTSEASRSSPTETGRVPEARTRRSGAVSAVIQPSGSAETVRVTEPGATSMASMWRDSGET